MIRVPQRVNNATYNSVFRRITLPITKSAKKDLRRTERRTLTNKAARSRAKTMITKTENQFSTGDVETARQTLVVAVRALDKAAGKGVIHPNNAGRRKSRLMKKANRASAAAQKPAP
jgi:small subunit ribosomal protein S20